jgi:hypothetical protein
LGPTSFATQTFTPMASKSDLCLKTCRHLHLY